MGNPETPSHATILKLFFFFLLINICIISIYCHVYTEKETTTSLNGIIYDEHKHNDFLTYSATTTTVHDSLLQWKNVDPICYHGLGGGNLVSKQDYSSSSHEERKIFLKHQEYGSI